MNQAPDGLSTNEANHRLDTSPSRRRLQALGLMPGLVVGTKMIWGSSWVYDGSRRFTLFDDAMISMSYARTLATTGELVWYPGAPRIEGITNPLWTFIMALLHFLGLSGSSSALTIMMLGLASVLAAAWISGGIVSRILPNTRYASTMAVFLTGLLYPALFWATRGMEVGALCLVLTISIAAVIDVFSKGDKRSVALLSTGIALGVAIRLDFILIASVLVGWLAFVSPRRTWATRLAVPIAALALTMAAMTWMRWSYYESWVPNTYVLKVEGVALTHRVERGVITMVKMAPVIALAMVSVIYTWHRVDRPVRNLLVIPPLVAAVAIAYSIFAGGDAWEFMPNRYVVPALISTVILVAIATELWLDAVSDTLSIPTSALVVLSGAGLAVSRVAFVPPYSLTSYLQPWFGAAGLSLMLVAWLFVHFSRQLPTSTYHLAALVGVSLFVFTATSLVGVARWTADEPFGLSADQTQTELGLALRDVANSRVSVAVSYAGSVIYYSGQDGIDLLGKSDPVIASSAPRIGFYPGHNKWDYDWSIGELAPDIVADLSRQPDYADQGLKPGYEKMCFQGSHSVEPIWVKKGLTALSMDGRFQSCESLNG